MSKTIDIDPIPAKSFKVVESWEVVAKRFGTSPKTIERDRDALGLFKLPARPAVIAWIGLMRAWVCLGSGGKGQFSRPNFMAHKRSGELEEKLKQFGILKQDEQLPDFPKD